MADLKFHGKKGDVSTTILVIGIFFVCVLALANFYYSNVSFKNSFSGIVLLEKVNSFSNEIEFYKNPDIQQKPGEIMNLFDGIKEGNFEFGATKENEKYFLNATYSERENKFLGFGFGNLKRIVYVEYEK